MDPPAEDRALLMEMLRQAERVLDHQLRTMEEMDDKSEQMIALSVGTLGGALALFAYLQGRAPAEPPSTVLLPGFAFGLLSELLALLAFLDAYVGLSRRAVLHAGPDLAWLARKSNQPEWSLGQHLVTLLQNYPVYFHNNARAMGLSGSRRKWGLAFLLMGVLLQGATALYVLEGGMRP